MSRRTKRTVPRDSDRSRERRATLDRLGAHRVLAHAHALACRAWQPYAHYSDPDLGNYLRHDSPTQPSSLPLEDALEELFAAGLLDAPSYRTPHNIVAEGDVTALPDAPYDPGSLHAHPALVELANAITTCMPAVVLALLDDGSVPADLATGHMYRARFALAALDARYRGSERPLTPGTPEHSTRPLTRPPMPSDPIEWLPTWEWMVYVTQEPGCPGPSRLGAHDHMPLRCFADLQAARRFAILQTDWSRHTASLPRDAEFHDAIARLAEAEPDGSELSWGEATYMTVIVPRSDAELPAGVPSA